jgi:hypothetical protein
MAAMSALPSAGRRAASLAAKKLIHFLEQHG